MSKSKEEVRIAIIGMGFCGLMTAIHLIKNAGVRLKLYLINDKYPFAKGPAFGTHSPSHLLNVPAEKMSSLPDQPSHFVDWLHKKAPYSQIDKTILGKMYVPRQEYGNYLLELWDATIGQRNNNIEVLLFNSSAKSLVNNDLNISIVLRSGELIEADIAVLATGNDVPGDPRIKNTSFYANARYFNNPWDAASVKGLGENDEVLIIGNGLTMIDTVLGLREQGLKGKIYSISPHGFNILQHRDNGVVYTRLNEELKEPYDINELFRLFRKHISLVRKFGLSAEPVVDAIRPYSQKIWQGLSLSDKRRFMSHLRHLWGVARHRLPVHIHDLIQNMRIDEKLLIMKGRLIDLEEVDNKVRATFFNGRTKMEESLIVDRVINCTGPLMDLGKSQNALLKDLVSKGIICPDELKLGVATDQRGAIIDRSGKVNERLFTLGGNLRGLLWESTAVPELRVQVERLAALLLKKCEAKDI